MKKVWLIYGLVMGLMVFLIKISEYLFWMKYQSMGYYMAFTALLFLVMGWWLSKKHNRIDDEKRTNHQPADINHAEATGLKLSKREMEVLQLLGQGMSNQEIADQLFVSENTVKTHTNRIFEKLGIKSRAQAMVKAKEIGMI